MKKALEKIQELNIDAIIHCGDLCAPFMIKELEKAEIQVHLVFGNTDDKYITTKLCEASKLVTLYGDFAEIEIDKKKIAFSHFPQYAQAFAKSGQYNAVFYGHTHSKDKKIINTTLLVNPGEIMGKSSNPTIAVYDTESNSIEFVDI